VHTGGPHVSSRAIIDAGQRGAPTQRPASRSHTWFDQQQLPAVDAVVACPSAHPTDESAASPALASTLTMLQQPSTPGVSSGMHTVRHCACACVAASSTHTINNAHQPMR